MNQYDRLAEAIRKSHDVVSYIDIITPVQETIRVYATEGDVKVDGTATIRRSCSFKCIDPDGSFTPSGPRSALTPFGTEVRPYRGARFTDGTEYAYPLGVFRVSTSDVVDTTENGIEISVQCYDKSRTIQRDKFTGIYVIAVGINVIDAIKAVTERTFPDQEYDLVSTPRTVTAPMVFDAGGDPWDVISTLALSIGCSAYFDVYGRLAVAPAEDLNATPTPSFTYIEGPKCTMLDLTKSYTDEPGFNGVVVVGESPGDGLAPVRAEAWDMDPSSPTYRFGPYGEVPYVHTDQNVKTADDAQIVANQILQSMLGYTSQLSITTMVNPLLEAGMVVQVERAKSYVTGLYIADVFDIPLRSSATQSITVREKRYGGAI